MSSQAKWNLSGLDAVKKNIERLENKEIQWGFFRKRYGPDNDNLYVAQVASWQEDGTNKIPPREFFTTNVLRIISIGDPVGSRFSWLMLGVVKDAFYRKRGDSSLKELAEFTKMSLQEEILDWAIPANSIATQKSKGFNDPLIESGYMYDSVEGKVKTSRANKNSDGESSA